MIQAAPTETWGDLPVDWDLVKMAHAVRIPNGLVDPTDERYFRLRLIAPNHIESHTARLTAWQSAEEQGASSGKYLVEQGDLVYSKIRPKLNKVAVAPERCLCSADMYPIRPRREFFSSNYLLYVMLSTPFWKRTVDESMRVAMPKVNRDSLGSIRVPVPPLPIQRAIASFLDCETGRIDRLIEKKRRLLDFLVEERTALITRAVTRGLDPDVVLKDSQVEWIGQIPEHWEIRQARHLCAFSRPIIYGIVLPGPDVPEGVALIKGGDVDRGELKPERLSRTAYDIEAKHTRSRVGERDIVYSIRGSFGEAAIVPAELAGANITQDAARLSPRDSVDEEWLTAVLTSAPLRATAEAGAVGATIKGVNIRDLRRLPIPTPPHSEQVRIAKFLGVEERRIRKTEKRVREAVALLQEYRSALISAAVTGAIEVAEAATAAPRERRAAKPTFARALIAAEIIQRLHDRRRFGRVKLMKLMYIIEQEARDDRIAGTYYRKAAGPLDNRGIRSIERILAQNRWSRASEQKGRVEYQLMDRAGDHAKYLGAFWSDKEQHLSRILELFAGATTRQVEMVATLYAAWNDLLLSGQEAHDQQILQEVLENWHEQKALIPGKRWRKALAWMKRKGLVPRGKGKRTKQIAPSAGVQASEPNDAL